MRTCEYCNGDLEGDEGQCLECEARFEAEWREWRGLYAGEQRAGLHGEFTEEGLEMRRQERGVR